MTRVRIAYSISLPASLAARLEQYATRQERSRSDVVRLALTQYLPPLQLPFEAVVPILADAARPKLGSPIVRPKLSHASPALALLPETLESELVKHVMPDATTKECLDARSRRWFNYLRIMAQIAGEQETKGDTEPDMNKDIQTFGEIDPDTVKRGLYC